MIIERMRHSSNGAVNPNAWPAIQNAELLAADQYIAYLRDIGELTTGTHVARIEPITRIDPDLQPYVTGESDCFVFERTSDNDTFALVYDLGTKRGVQRQVYKNEGPEYYEVDESHQRFLGFDLLEEIFEPGSHPELSELAITSGPSIVNPSEMNARLMTPEEYRRSRAQAALSKFALIHLEHTLAAYSSVAYPDQERSAMSAEELKHYYDDLIEGVSVGLRTGTKYVSCAKHELRADIHTDQFETWLYLNYDIPFGPVKLHFDGDIDMAVALGEELSDYFQREGI